jgi:hypothetical protein
MDPPDDEARVPSTTPKDSIKPALMTNSDGLEWAKE